MSLLHLQPTATKQAEMVAGNSKWCPTTRMGLLVYYDSNRRMMGRVKLKPQNGGWGEGGITVVRKH